MPAYICKTCGSQYPESSMPPDPCPICQDERQYVGWNGQEWTTLDELRAGHRNEIRACEADLFGIGTTPQVAIGQRALLIRSSTGNILWDCTPLVDTATVEAVQKLDGIHGIAVSHPHFYSTMVEWAHAFDAPIYVHAADRPHVMRPDPAITYWDGESKPLGEGMTLINAGGHFAGGTVLHWAAGAGGRGVLLSADIVNVVRDRRYVSFMYSYPNLIPLPARTIRQIVAKPEPFRFQRIYGGWWDSITPEGGEEAVRLSAERYIRAIEGTAPGLAGSS